MNPTRNVEAEQAALGSILLSPELIKETRLEPKHFTPTHSIIFQAMRDADERHGNLEVITVATELGDALSQIGGVSYLTQLTDSVPSTESFVHYERLILDAYELREGSNLAQKFMENPTHENLNELHNRLGELQENGHVEEKSKKDLLIKVAEKMYEDQGDITGIPTGFKDLDDMTGGLQNGDLIIVAARPSMGKTAFALNLATENCKNGGVSDIFSLEMVDEQLVYRMLSSVGRIHGSKWRNPARDFVEKDYYAASHALGVLGNWNFNINDKSGQSVYDIRAAVRKSMKKYPDQPHLVVIDYLQLITVVGKFDRHDLAIGHITRELKNMAREFNIPVVLLSQLSRGVEQRQDKRPMLSDLRDSGNIEQDADIVMMLYRDEYYNRETEFKDIVELILAKHRNGPVGNINLLFEKQYGKFKNLDRF